MSGAYLTLANSLRTRANEHGSSPLVAFRWICCSVVGKQTLVDVKLRTDAHMNCAASLRMVADEFATLQLNDTLPRIIKAGGRMGIQRIETAKLKR